MTELHYTNQNGQPIGEPIENWQGAKNPTLSTITGEFCRLEPLDAEQHSSDLYAAFTNNIDNTLWTYLPYGPFDNKKSFQDWIKQKQTNEEELFYTIIDINSNKPKGISAYLRITPSNGVIEIGHIVFSPSLQRTTIATEAIFLLLQQAFDQYHYRRCEWKCDALNASSRRAAERFGFQFEGIFRQATVYKNRNRDTAWFAIIDKDWQSLKKAFTTWLSPENFDKKCIQHKRLQDFQR